MSNAMMQRRIRDILMAQAAMTGSGSKRCARGSRKRCVRKRSVVRKRRVSRGRGYGTHIGAIKGWEHRYKRMLHGRGTRSGAKHSGWIKYVKQYMKQHGISYKEALMEAGPSYRAMHGRGGVLVGGRRRRVTRRRSGSKTARRRIMR